MPERRGGPIAWMAANHVAANLLMLVFLVGGLVFALNVKQEVFPRIDPDTVTIDVPFPGATPTEVEEGVVLAIEESIRDVEEIKEIRSTAVEGRGVVVAELFAGSDTNAALNDIKSAVDRITSFPAEAEEPIIAAASNRQQVITPILHGDLDRHALKGLAEQARDELLDNPEISLVELAALPPPEISIEIRQEDLRRYGVTLPEVARLVDQSSIQLGAGSIEARGGEILVRVDERRESAEALRKLELFARADGGIVRLGDIAEVDDTFRDIDRQAFFDGQPAAQVRVYRVGDQSPLEIAEIVKGYVEDKRREWPDSVGVTFWQDQSELFADRIGLLVDNGQLGVILVLVVLGLFLRPALAFWVTLGLPVSFLGAFLFMPLFDVSVNMISLFAFLLVLGIVVDDAIVVGEATFHHRQRGMPPLQAAIQGAREVGVPVVFAVLTTMVAFAPMLFVPGTMGKFFIVIPLTVIPILLISLIESLFILPAHLSSVREVRPWRGPLGGLQRLQERISSVLERFIHRRYRPFLARALRHRYLTLATGLAALIVVIGLLASGRMPVRFLPDIENDTVTANLELPIGAAMVQTESAIQTLIAGARDTAAALSREGAPGIEGVYAEVGGEPPEGGPGGQPSEQGAGNQGFVQVELVGAGMRDFSARDFVRRWRDSVGEIPGVERLSFAFGIGPGTQADIGIELAHRDQDTLEEMAGRLAREIGTYAGTYNIDEGFQRGKPQFEVALKPTGRALGLDAENVAGQLRGAFFGAEAERQQRGRDELRIYVRLPEHQRNSLDTLENFILRTPDGGEIPLDQAATLTYSRSFTSIGREGGRRVIDVTADVDPAITSGTEITEDLRRTVIPQLKKDFPGMDWELSGGQEERAESLAALGRGMLLALFVMYALIAVAFRSYAQPLLVMLAIPFGLIGAVAGHALMGMSLSLVSVFGLVALAGVVVNDSLVLITAVNDARQRGHGAAWATVIGGVRRFRAVLLTSLTTFFGLLPMMSETSMQARFLIPMAVSLGFGVLFVTVIALILIPAAYLALEDLKRFAARQVERVPHPEPESP